MNAKTIKIQVSKTTEVNFFENGFKNGKDVIHGTICIGGYLFIQIVMRKGQKGWYICYPFYKDESGGYKDLVFATKAFNDAIIKKFEEALKVNETPTTNDNETPTTNDIETAEELPF